MLLVALLLPACALLDRGEDDHAPVTSGKASAHVPDGTPTAGKSTAVDPDEVAELQLKQTRLAARIEELEGKFSRQQERLKIIERGLTLGIVPDELKAPAHDSAKLKPVSSTAKKPEKQVAAKKPEHNDHEADDLSKGPSDNAHAAHPSSGQGDTPAVAAPAGEPEIPAATRSEFDKAFAAAHEDYRAGRYGKAIVSFSEIGQKFDPRLTVGVHKFWIARCWSGLKEMQTARQLFTEFIGAHPASPWAPRAKLELARVESALGLKETAIKRLRGVISEHPMDDVAEMAKAEVERMSKTL